MNHPWTRHTAAILACALTAATLAAQQPVPVALVPLGAPHPHGFSSVAGVRELRDGRVIVVDATERTVSLIAWNTATPVVIGRAGSGPLEYTAPRAIFNWPGDSTIIHDIGNSRYLILTPDGKPARTFAGSTRLGFGYTPLRGADVEGRLYVEARNALVAGVETQPILRWAPGTDPIDTAGLIRRPPLPPSRGTAATAPAAATGRGVTAIPRPFHARDEWALAQNGDVVLVHAQPYAVEWVRGRGSVRGPEQPYVPRPVTEADKDEWRAQQAGGGRGRTIQKPGDADARTGAPTTMQVRITDPDFAETMPAFLAGAVSVAPDQSVWVQRTRDPKATIETFDVFDAVGKLVRRVTLPAGNRIAGFGSSTTRDGLVVFTTSEDDSGFIRLQRYRTRIGPAGSDAGERAGRESTERWRLRIPLLIGAGLAATFLHGHSGEH